MASKPSMRSSSSDEDDEIYPIFHSIAEAASAASQTTTMRMPSQKKITPPQDSSFEIENGPQLLPAGAGGGGLQAVAVTQDGEKLASSFELFVNILICFIGTGILALPYAFSRGGILLSAITLVLVAILSMFCMHKLVETKRALERAGAIGLKATYGDVADAAGGVHMKRAVNTMLIVSQLGFSTAYLIFVADNLSSVIPSLSRAEVVGFCVPILCAVSCIRDIARLAPFSLVADAAILFSISVVFVTDAKNFSYHRDVSLFVPGSSATRSPLPFLFGMFVYCFEGIGMVLPLEASAADRTQFPKLLFIGIGLIVTIYLAFGLAGYCAYGSETEDLITMNLDPSKSPWTTTAVKTGLSIGLLLTYPMMMMPVYHTIETQKTSTWYRITVRSLLVILTAIVGISVPGFSEFISLIGSIACSVLAFVIPVVLHILVMGHELTNRKIFVESLVATFGTIGGLFGAIDTISNL